MSETLEQIRVLVARGDVRVSLHGYEAFTPEADMSARLTQRLVREGELIAEVDVTLIETDDGWTPHLSLEDAYKLDDVRDALRTGDLKAASRLATQVYRLTPLEA